MELIDRNAFDSDLLGTLIPDIFLRNKRRFTVGEVRTMLKRRPTIDPVHAAGACYCRECVYKKKARVNKKGFLICPASGMEIVDHYFCSYGEREESKCQKSKK